MPTFILLIVAVSLNFCLIILNLILIKLFYYKFMVKFVIRQMLLHIFFIDMILSIFIHVYFIQLIHDQNYKLFFRKLSRLPKIVLFRIIQSCDVKKDRFNAY